MAGFLVKTVCARLFAGSKRTLNRGYFPGCYLLVQLLPFPSVFSSRQFPSLLGEQEISVSLEGVLYKLCTDTHNPSSHL